MENQFIYSKNVIEFVTVVAETCLFLENSREFSKEDFVMKSIKILPLLYLKTTLIDVSEIETDENAEKFVTEEDYLFVKEQIETLLGTDDAFLDTFHPDMQYSDTPIAAFISENLADVYQELKDFAANYQTEVTEVMESALYVCMQAFAEHWGQKLLNALRALHAVRYKDNFGEIEDEERFKSEDYRKLDRNSFLRFQADDENDDEI
ncbi:conserved hypothetical protein [uncultured Paludibacter sp.]|uniref:DUF5063 domain-containing protein n=1 Tax=uncultured Paludibacter sp. TaxID=497635 RepID=A0A653AFG2_9BACT|nr:conserved hypothetical protein [uncultured Paludibacter sp.]